MLKYMFILFHFISKNIPIRKRRLLNKFRLASYLATLLFSTSNAITAFLLKPPQNTFSANTVF